MENYKMNDGVLEKLTNMTNRSKGQTQFLYNLCEGSLYKLVELEEKLANNFIHYCPGDKECMEKVLAMGYGDYHFKLKPCLDCTVNFI